MTVVLPCLNEAETLEGCINEIQKMADDNNIKIEIIVADNGSTDDSLKIAERYQVKIVNVQIRGYGAALHSGIFSSSNEFVLMGDSDMSYNFSHAPDFLKALNSGADLVIGNRFRGGIQKGAMPWLHRYLGNPALSVIARILFRIPIYDFHCGLRAIRKSVYLKASPVTTGMEFATEMIIRIVNVGGKVIEVPTELRVDGRSRAPHLRSFPDGWRHLKLMLLYSPRFLQIYPGTMLMFIGISGVFQYFFFGEIDLLFAKGSSQTGVFSLVSLSLGAQLFVSGILNMEYAKQKGVLRFTSGGRFMKLLRSRLGVGVACGLLALGFLLMIPLLLKWQESGFSYLDPIGSSKIVFMSSFFGVMGAQILISALQVRQFASRFW
jgi:glycosyltransferase involved in cell wall biosynthesis